MKRLSLIAGFLFVAGYRSDAQTFSVMAEQLAALQALEQTTAHGYQLMTSGLDTIGTITAGEFQLHRTYFASLAAINPSVTSDPKLLALRDLQNALLQQIEAALSYWRRQQNHQQ